MIAQTLPISVEVPLRLVGEANARDSRWMKSRRVAEQRGVVRWYLTSRCRGLRGCAVTLTRLAPRQFDDFDNLVSSLKAVRDGVADALGTSDRDALVAWDYAQEKHATYAVRIDIRRAVACACGCHRSRGCCPCQNKKCESNP